MAEIAEPRGFGHELGEGRRGPALDLVAEAGLPSARWNSPINSSVKRAATGKNRSWLSAVPRRRPVACRAQELRNWRDEPIKLRWSAGLWQSLPVRRGGMLRRIVHASRCLAIVGEIDRGFELSL